MNHLSIVGVVLLLVSFTSNAEDMVALYGTGSSSCGALIVAFREDAPSMGIANKGRIFYAKSKLYSEWLAGFFSSYNSLKSQTGDFAKGSDMEGLMEWVRSYCEKNPTHSVNRAAVECIRAVEKQK